MVVTQRECLSIQWRRLCVIVCTIAACVSLTSLLPIYAADPTGGAAPYKLNEIAVPQNLLTLIEQVLSGPKHAAAALDYQIAAANTQATLGDLQPQLALSVQSRAYAPFSDSAADTKVGLIAGPGLILTLPTGQGQTQITVGAAARTGYSSVFGAQANITTQIPLLAGPDTRQASAKQALSSAQAEYLRKQRQLVLDAVKAYYAVQAAEQELTLTEQLYQLASLAYTLGDEQFQRGTLSSTELYLLRQAMNSATDQHRTALFDLEKAKADLQSLVGGVTISIADASDLSERLLQVDAPADLTADVWVALALERRDDLHLAQEAEALAKLKLDSIEAKAGKEINLVAGATWPNKVTETSVDFRTDVQIGVQATFHLADPARRQNVVAAQAGYEKARLHTQELQQQIAREIATALFRVQEIEQTLAQAQMHLEQLETNLAVVRERLAQGLAVAQDAAEQELNVAQQVGRIRQLAGERVIAYLTLWHAAGLDAVALQIPAF
jgi:outer membrane protein TolC